MIIPAAFAPAGGLITCSTLEDPSMNASEVEKEIKLRDNFRDEYRPKGEYGELF